MKDSLKTNETINQCPLCNEVTVPSSFKEDGMTIPVEVCSCGWWG